MCQNIHGKYSFVRLCTYLNEVSFYNIFGFFFISLLPPFFLLYLSSSFFSSSPFFPFFSSHSFCHWNLFLRHVRKWTSLVYFFLKMVFLEKKKAKDVTFNWGWYANLNSISSDCCRYSERCVPSQRRSSMAVIF